MIPTGEEVSARTEGKAEKESHTAEASATPTEEEASEPEGTLTEGLQAEATETLTEEGSAAPTKVAIVVRIKAKNSRRQDVSHLKEEDSARTEAQEADSASTAEEEAEAGAESRTGEAVSRKTLTASTMTMPEYRT